MLLAGAFAAAPARAERAGFILDVGHDPSQSGATSAGGEAEYAFNLAFARRLAEALAERDLQARLFLAEPDLALIDRAAAHAGIPGCAILSLHHDSVQETDLRSTEAFGGNRLYTDAAEGFSLFVSSENGSFERSVDLARVIGHRLVAHGFTANHYHRRDRAGEGRPVVDDPANVHRYDGLAVLRRADRPAALLEIAVITNPLDEARARDPDRVARFASAVADALAAFAETC